MKKTGNAQHDSKKGGVLSASKRVVNSILSVVLVIGLMPSMAWADDLAANESGHELNVVTTEEAGQPIERTKTADTSAAGADAVAADVNQTSGDAMSAESVMTPMAETITVGTGTVSNYTQPYRNYYKNGTNQMMYTADEIGTSGTITAIAFNVATASSWTPTSVKVYMATTKNTQLTTSNAFTTENSTLVYSGTPTLGASTGWETLTLDTSYEYNTTDGDLVVIVAQSSSSYNSSLKYYSTTISGLSIGRGSDSNTDYADATSASGYSTLTTRANIQLTMETCDHEGATFVSTTAPTCTEGGYDTYYCSKCEKNIKKNETAALGHAYENTTAYACDKDGVADENGKFFAQKCDRYEACGYTKVWANPEYAGTWDGSSAEAWTHGSGTQDDPYLIETASNLAYLSAQVMASSSNTYSGKYFKVTTDLDMSAGNFLPIGGGSSATSYSTSYKFCGNFDGDGHSITLAQSIGRAYSGLFGYVGSFSDSATIKNVVVKGTVNNTSGAYVGGVCGYLQNSTMSNCRNEATVTAVGNDVGGLVGSCYGTILTSSNTGNITSTGTNVGGVTGYMTQYSTATVTDCYNNGAITGSNQVGGVVGYAYAYMSGYAKKITNCYSSGAISATTTSTKYYGGVCGQVTGSSSTNAAYLVFTNCYCLDTCDVVCGGTTSYATLNTVESKTSSELAGLAGTLGDNYMAGSPYPVLTWEAPAGCPVITTQPADATYVKDATPDALSVAASSSEGYALSYQWYKNGEVIEGATSMTYTPSTSEIGTASYYCVVTAASLELYPTTSGTATVKVWSGATAATPTISAQPASASYMQGETATALSVTASVTDGGVLTYQWYNGEDAIAGATESTYTPSTAAIGEATYKCVVTNTLEGESTATATTETATITVSGRTISTAADLKAFAAEVAAGDTKAGYTTTLLADIDATLEGDDIIIGTDSTNCFKGTFEGNGHTIKVAISSDAQYVGLFGYVNGATIQNLVLKGTVTSTYAPSSVYTAGDCGGLIAYGTNSTVKNVGNEANVTFNTTSTAAACYAGGIAGYLSGGSIDGCYNTGTIKANTAAAGIAGYFFGGTVSNCYNTGDVTGAGYYTGGIAGLCSGTYSSSTTYLNCYAAGKVGGTSSTGTGVVFGSASNSYSTETNCMYANDINGDMAGIGNISSGTHTVAAKTSAELQAAAADLNSEAFATDYYAQNNGFPVLAWQQTGIAAGTPKITDQTRSQNVPTSETALNLSVTASVDALGATLTYQWYKDGVAINGATAATYAADITTAGTHTYACEVSNGDLMTKSADIVILAYAQAAVPTVSVSPEGPIEVKQGGAAQTLTATASSTDEGATLTYQWQYSEDGEAFYDVSGMTSATFTVPSSTLGDTWYRCVVTSTVVVADNTATTTSDAVKATVVPLTIESVDDWKGFAATVNGGDYLYGVTVYLGADLTLTSDDMAAVGTYSTSSGYKFQGTFDGQGHTITLSDVSVSTASTAALFGYIGESGTVRNLNVEGSVTTSTQYAGGIASNNYGTIENCTNAASVKTTYSSGYAGGIAGQNYGFVKSCGNTGSVSAAGTSTCYAAGIVGYNYHSVSGCYNTGAVSVSTTGSYTSAYAGGIVGYCSIYYSGDYGVSISDCYNMGSVSAEKAATGSSYYARACGIAGYVPYSSSSATKNYELKNCYSTGTLASSITGSTVTTGCQMYGIAYNSTSSSYANYLIYDNLYFLEGTADAALCTTSYCQVTNVSSKAATDLKDAAMVDTLNGTVAEGETGAWIADETSINSGYPILAWQKPAAHVHTLVKVDEVPATCTQAGTEAYWKCSECSKMFSDEEGTTEIEEPVAIPAKGHTLTAVEKVDPTYEAAGCAAYWTCSVCNKAYSDEAATTEIEDLAAWKAEGGDGYIAPLPTISDATLTFDASATFASIKVDGQAADQALVTLSADFVADGYVPTLNGVKMVKDGTVWKALVAKADASSIATRENVSTVKADADTVASVKGDVTMSGVTNIVDAQAAYDVARGRYGLGEGAASLTMAQFLSADVNDTPGVDASDAFAIQYIIHHPAA